MKLSQWVFIFLLKAYIFSVSGEPILSIIKTELKNDYYCTLTNDSMNSALSWDSQNTIAPSSVVICNSFKEKGICSLGNTTTQHKWKHDTYYPLTLDYRWEGIAVQKINFNPPVMVHEVEKDDFEYSFSFKGAEFQIFLCDREYSGSYGNCYWFALGAYNGNRSYLRECKEKTIPITPDRYDCSKAVDENEIQNAISESKWNHFTLKKASSAISVQDDLRPEILLEYKNISEEFKLKYVLVRHKPSQVYVKQGFMKFHKVNTFSTTSKGSTAKIHVSTSKPITCLSIYIKACKNCVLRAQLLDSSDHPLASDKASGDEKWKELILNGQKAISSARVTIKVEISEGSIEPSNPLWSISEIVRDCSGTVIPSVRGDTGCCSALKYPEKRLCIANLTAVPATTEGSSCTTNEIGENCMPIGSIFNSTMSRPKKICQLINNTVICSCGAGFYETNCEVGCPSGKYGHKCRNQCGKCKNGGCVTFNGRCTSGCEENFDGNTCSIAKLPILKNVPTINNLSFHEAVVDINWEYDGQYPPKLFEIQYSKNNSPSSWENINGKNKYENAEMSHKISGLQSNTEYIVRVILYDGNDKAYDGEFVPILSFKTLCANLSRDLLKEVIRDTSITVNLVSDNSEICPHEEFTLLLYKGKELKLSRKVVSGPIYFQVDPYTNYKLKVERNKTEITSWDIQTAEGTPEPVQDIKSETNDTSAEIRWKEPNKPNGIIRGYQVECFLIKSKACLYPWPQPIYLKSINVTDTKIVLDKFQPYSEYQINIAPYTIYLGAVTIHKFETKPTDKPTTEEIPQLSIKQTQNSFVIDFKWNCTSVKGNLLFGSEFICKSPWCHTDIEPYKEEFINLWSLAIQKDYNITGKTNYTLKMYISRDTNATKLIKEVTYLTNSTKPNKVQNLTIYSKTDNSMSVRWQPPYPPTGDIDAYWIKWYFYNNNKQKVDRTSGCAIWPGQICTTIDNLPTDQRIYLDVYAKNIGVNEEGEINRVSATVKEEAPKPPQNVTLEWDDRYGLKIKWHHPDVTNGPLTEFLITINNIFKESHKVKVEEPQYEHKLNISEIANNFTTRNLIVHVTAVNSVGSSTAISEIPSPPKMPEFSSKPTIKEIKNTNFTIYIPTVSDVEGSESEMFIIVTDIQKSMEVETGPDEGKLLKEININTTNSWIVGSYNLKKFEAADFIVGSDSTISGQKKYKNPKLMMGNTYNVTIVLRNTYMGYSRQREYPLDSVMVLPSETSGLIYLLLLLLVPVIVICGILLWRNHHKVSSSLVAGLQQLRLPRIDVPMRPLGRENNTPTPQAVKSESMVNTMINDSPSEDELKFSKPVKISDLNQYVKQAIESGELERQHGMFHRGQTKPWTYGSKPQNKTKNRYANLAAYDHTRVKLQIINKDPFSDYINANYIDGYKLRRAYIATQGPKPNTLNDFWRMIWQEKVEHIIMIANIIEGGKKKVEKYWPEINETKTFDNIKVKYVSVDVMANYETRCFTACKDGEERRIEQLHFLTWPDHGVPLYAQSLSPFLRKMLTISQGKAPVLVHCSAGVGRTGSLILCDICLRMAAREGKIDVFYYLYKIREQRVNMVDNIEQYKLVHLALLQCLVAPETGILCNEKMEDKINTIITTKIEEQMKYLDESAWQDEAMRSSGFSSNSLVVHSKNRFTNILPDPASKITLSPYPSSDESSTYINAISVDAFVTPSKFVVTQNPLPSTVGDFWRLVDEKDVTIIICLNHLDFGDKTTCKFYPTLNMKTMKPVPYLEVKYVNKEAKTHHKVCKVVMRRIEEEEDIVINIIHFNKWNNDMAHPQNPNGLLMIYEEMNRLGWTSDRILVACHDGVTACGLFVAMCFIIDKIKMEQVCDVCLAVNTVRHSRKEFVRTPEQFAFLYNCALEYVGQFDMYSNFKNF